MSTLLVFFCVMMAIISYKRAMAAKAQEAKEDALLQSNPEAWQKVQELKMEKADRKRRAATDAAITTAKWWLKK